MKYAEERPYADPEKAARLLELAYDVEPVQDGRIHIEKINYPFLFQDRPSRRIWRRHQIRGRARLAMAHESGTCVKITPGGAGPFA